MIEDSFAALTAAGTAVAVACRLLGRSRASHYRHARGTWQGPRQRRAPGPQALDAAERAAVLDVINRPGYGQLSIGQIWVRELDEGRYWCSLSSMYRIAAAAGQTRERRRPPTHARRSDYAGPGETRKVIEPSPGFSPRSLETTTGADLPQETGP